MKKRFLAYLEIDEETLLKATDRENVIEALQDEFSWSEPHGVSITSIKEHDWICCTSVELPLYIRVLDGKITDIAHYSNYFKQGFSIHDIDINVSYEFTENSVINQYEWGNPTGSIDLPLYITVVDGKVTEIWYDSNYDNQDYLVNASDYSVEYKSTET